eukprot:scaffold17072_cov28-Phaeocystis_antarctica.AAC.1
MPIKYLREVLRSGIVGNGNGRRGRQVRRACFPYARPPSMPSKPLPCHGLEARGCRGAVAYRRSSTPRDLREGRQSGRSWGNGDGTRGRQVRRARFLYVPNPYSARAWRRGCRGAAAHSVFSAVSSPSCEGRLPVR